MASPPLSPVAPQRPMSAMRPPRSASRMSVSSKQGNGSRASDEDGKTSVKVAVRVRPPLRATDPGFELIPQRFQRSMVQVTSPTTIAVDAQQGRKVFVFDRVFGEDIDQQGVWDYLHDSVDSFLQGYNVSILAYGQSGAGKSYTMGTSGPAEQNDPEIMGIIPRAAAVLFETLGGSSQGRNNSGLRTPTRYSVNTTSTLQSLQRIATDKSWQLKATYVEIYNEQLRDLLVPETVPNSERSAVTIREDTKGRIILTGLHQVNINGIEDLLNALNFGSSIRQTDATAINAKSSRSHAVFSLNLIQRKTNASLLSKQEKRRSVPVESFSGSEPLVTVDSKLHFVDLAGSERLKNTGASGERAKEGISINAGLASLGKVISQLSSRQPGAHVSYRDSKLTRLLQDSLGGNAITYMIACVTPAEFHLSETLNTVSYAQRARAIQSKPRIQQIQDDSDKQAVIDRLRQEVAFLRAQIDSSGKGGDSRRQPTSERQTGREVELQNNLLDMQESYSALSKRHAKLVSEISKSGSEQSLFDTPNLNGMIGESASERLKRSKSAAETVENLILEYEKTIEILESSLSQTRSSLSSSESLLLERETQCTYAETKYRQVEARLQKMMDREANTENYLHDLEAKLDGHTSGEEKNAAIIAELRKEIARVRENEANCEDYISTLEERLAEADQDMELMQREVDRLEHVVERQRSLGKLDNLLHELDHIQQNGKEVAEEEKLQDRPYSLERGSSPTSKRSSGSLREAANTAIPESEDEVEDATPGLESDRGDSESDVQEDMRSPPIPTDNQGDNSKTLPQDYSVHSPAQSKFVAEKLDMVTHELFDLRMEHETTVNEYELLQAKYEEALRTLAELQDAVDEARHSTSAPTVASPASSRPESFLGNVKMNEHRNSGHLSSSQPLSSELSSVGESTVTTEPSEAELTPKKPALHEEEPTPKPILNQDSEKFQDLLREKDESMSLLIAQHAQLQNEHQETLEYVQELKSAVETARKATPTSPIAPVIRRKVSENIMANDRANRSLAQLRNLAIDEFEERPETMSKFEQNLNAAMHELHTRMEKIRALEAENANVKKEMDTKMTIIAGLTKERSSLKGSGHMDISVASSMRQELLNSENQIRSLQESHSARESELLTEIRTLTETLDRHKESARSPVPGDFPATPDLVESKQLVVPNEQDEKIAHLQEELSQWQSRHQSAVESMQASEKQLLTTLSELESAMISIEEMRKKQAGEQTSSIEQQAKAAGELEEEKVKHQQAVHELEQQIAAQQAVIDAHVDHIQDLEQTHSKARDSWDQGAKDRDVDRAQLAEQQSLVARLQEEIEDHKAQVERHKGDLKSLQETHQEELEKLRASEAEQYQKKLAEEAKRHESAVSQLHAELDKSKAELETLLESAARTLGHPTSPLAIANHIQQAKAGNNQASKRYSDLMEMNEQLQEELRAKDDDYSTLQPQLAELNERVSGYEAHAQELTNLIAQHERTIEERDNQIKKKNTLIDQITAEQKKSARLVDELEEQIANSYDLHNNRLSSMQTERQQALVEANAKIESLEKELETQRARVEQLEAHVRPMSPQAEPPSSSAGRDRSPSNASNLRKSASVASLPSPPPAIPLPPLPNIAGVNGSTSPPGSRHTSKELVNAQLVEDQEARIRTIEKHLHAEKQLTATLEEALVDLETQSNKIKADMEGWKKKAWACEDELAAMKRERNSQRLSVQAVEEERNARREAEAARAHLEERMNALSKKKKKSTLNCF